MAIAEKEIPRLCCVAFLSHILLAKRLELKCKKCESQKISVSLVQSAVNSANEQLGI